MVFSPSLALLVAYVYPTGSLPTTCNILSTAVFEEMELLRNVYFDELEISLGDCSEPQLKFHITPSTADDKDQQFVYLDVMVTLTATVG